MRKPISCYEEERNGSLAENLIKPKYHHGVTDLFLSYKGLLPILAKTIKIYATGQSETQKGRTIWRLYVYERGKKATQTGWNWLKY